MTEITINDLLDEARAAIDFIEAADCLALASDPEVLIVDVREGEELRSGAIPGAVHVPRGLLEFRLCPDSPMHDASLTDGRRLIFTCASGARAILAAHTARRLGLEAVCMTGGMQAWKASGGPTE